MKFKLKFTAKAESDGVGREGETCAGDHKDLAYFVTHGYVENVAESGDGEDKKPDARPPAGAEAKSETADVNAPVSDGSVRRGFHR